MTRSGLVWYVVIIIICSGFGLKWSHFHVGIWVVRTNSPNDYYVNILHGVWKSQKSLIQYILRALSGQMFIENAKIVHFENL